MKDTAGPSLNILMKLMAITSLIFAQYFVAINGVTYSYAIPYHRPVSSSRIILIPAHHSISSSCIIISYHRPV